MAIRLPVSPSCPADRGTHASWDSLCLPPAGEGAERSEADEGEALVLCCPAGRRPWRDARWLGFACILFSLARRREKKIAVLSSLRTGQRNCHRQFRLHIRIPTAWQKRPTPMGRPYKEVFIRKEWCSPIEGCTISFFMLKACISAGFPGYHPSASGVPSHPGW